VRGDPPSRQSVLVTDRRGRRRNKKPRPLPGRGVIGGVRRDPSPARGPSRHHRGQVSWLAAVYSPALPRNPWLPVGLLRLSVPLTVAGQRGLHTPLPFSIFPAGRRKDRPRCEMTKSESAPYIRRAAIPVNRVQGHVQGLGAQSHGGQPHRPRGARRS
jgi:hypothetical protein